MLEASIAQKCCFHLTSKFGCRLQEFRSFSDSTVLSFPTYKIHQTTHIEFSEHHLNESWQTDFDWHVDRKSRDIYTLSFLHFPPQKHRGFKWHSGWWVSYNCSLVNLKDNFMKFVVEIPLGTNCQERNDCFLDDKVWVKFTTFTKFNLFTSQGE